MHANRRHWLNLPATLLLVALGGLTATLVAATTESTSKPADKTAEAAPRVVSPPDHAVLLSGHLDVIYRGNKTELEVDSRPVSWEESYDAPIHVGHLHLSPGMHRVKIGDRNVQLCVALNEMEHDGPSDWKIYRAHTMSSEKDRCAECHDADTQDGRMVVGKLMAPDSCMACHTQSEVKKPHADFIQPLKPCQTCHALHGSPYKHLLKAPEAQIRKQHVVQK
jgi:doubled CXXCH motif protein